MSARANQVDAPPEGFVIALQFWSGDMPQAMRLAKLIADLEPVRRDDVTFAFCPRFDCNDGWPAAIEAVRSKFPTMVCQSDPTTTGHPNGSNGMWASIFAQLARQWQEGTLYRPAVFFCEPDGCPLNRDWINILKREHKRAVRAGKAVTGALTGDRIESDYPHINGSMLVNLSVWADHPSLAATPKDQAWDLFHGDLLLSLARPTSWIKNVYGAVDWSPGVLDALSKDVGWLSSTKDDSAVDWAERSLIG